MPPDSTTATVKVAIPYHLRNLACVDGDIALAVPAPVTLRSVLDALEARYPMLRGTIREYETGNRRAFLRFFACAEDFSLASPDTLLPDAVAKGDEPLLIIGAIAGG
jgi:sulfur-carrier protein